MNVQFWNKISYVPRKCSKTKKDSDVWFRWYELQLIRYELNSSDFELIPLVSSFPPVPFLRVQVILTNLVSLPVFSTDHMNTPPGKEES